MMTMKLGCYDIFFLLLLFIAGFQTSNAVQCYQAMTAGDLAFGEKWVECSSCARYDCGSKVHIRLGCPEHFFNDCKSYPNAVQFIKSKITNELAYHDGTVVFISGCPECLDLKVTQLNQATSKKTPSAATPAWFCKNPGDFDSCTPASGNSNDAIPASGNSNNTNPTSSDVTPTSGNSNVSIKLTEIIMATIGLLLTQIFLMI